jgi:two-component system NarL family sensor kinase
MDAPAETEFLKLLAVGIGLLLLLGALLVLFVVTYQKRLLQQQLRLRAAEAEYQQQLLAAVIEAQERERERIGRDLHDGIGSTIATAKMLVNRLETNQPADNRPELFGMVKEIMSTAVHDVRSISHSLFPAVLARYGLADALQHLVDVSNETGTLAIELEVDYPEPLALAQELALYRI